MSFYQDRLPRIVEVIVYVELADQKWELRNRFGDELSFGDSVFWHRWPERRESFVALKNGDYLIVEHERIVDVISPAAFLARYTPVEEPPG